MTKAMKANWFRSISKFFRPAPWTGQRLKARLMIEQIEERLVPAPIPPGTILVPDSVSMPTGVGAIIGVDPNTGAETVITSGHYLQAPQSVREDSDGTLLIVDNTTFGSGALIRYDPNHTAGDGQSVVSVGQFFQAPAALELVNGLIIVADPGAAGSYGTLLIINPQAPPTSNQTILTQGGSLAGPSALTPGPGNSIYVGDVTTGGGSVIQVDLTTHAQTVITQGDNLTTPADVAVDANGNIIVTDTGDTSMTENGAGVVVSVDPTTGDQTVLASGGYLNYSPNGHVLTADGQLFVSTLGFSDMGVPARILSIDLSTGDQAVIAEGGSLGYPGALAVYQPTNAPVSGEDAGLKVVAVAAGRAPSAVIGFPPGASMNARGSARPERFASWVLPSNVSITSSGEMALAHAAHGHDWSTGSLDAVWATLGGDVAVEALADMI
jgi:hypothetical protein